MRSMILAVTAVLGTATAHAGQCTQSVLEITNTLQAQRAEMVSACEIRQVQAAEKRHLELTGSNCAEGQQVKLVQVRNQSLILGASGEPVSFQSKVTVVNSGEGQPSDSFYVTADVDSNSVNTIDCKNITSVKLAPMDDGLPSPVEQPSPYKQHPRQ